MLKVGLVGGGAISRTHISAWESMENVELVALCDIRTELLTKYVGKKLYADYEEMLGKEQLDIVDICLPTFLHVECALKAIEKGIHVLCEKPLSLNKEDVKKVYDAAKAHQVKFMTAHVVRFMPEYAMLKTIYEDGRYGKLLSGTMYRFNRMQKRSWNSWLCDKEKSGLIPFDLHIHDCDFLVHAFGEPKSVVARRAQAGDQDVLNIMYEYPEFFVSAEAAFYCAGYPFAAGYRFQFEHALLEYKDGTCMVYEKDGTIVNMSAKIAPDDKSGYANEIRYFADCVAKDKSPEMVKPEELEIVIELLKCM